MMMNSSGFGADSIRCTGEIVDDGKCRWKFLWVSVWIHYIIAQNSSTQLPPEGARSWTSKNGAYPWVLSAGTPSFLRHSFTEHVMIWWLLLESPISVSWSNLYGWPKSPRLRSWTQPFWWTSFSLFGYVEDSPFWIVSDHFCRLKSANLGWSSCLNEFVSLVDTSKWQFYCDKGDITLSQFEIYRYLFCVRSPWKSRMVDSSCRSKGKILWTSQLQLPCGPSCWSCFTMKFWEVSTWHRLA